uniref:Uncharacterized protein n=1 Tax=Florenciella parvula TaxID=236787 RepID=A0A7S2CT38_9STRA
MAMAMAVAVGVGGTSSMVGGVSAAWADDIPAGCVYTGPNTSPYKYQRGNGNLNCGEGFVKGFAGEELIFTPLLLSVLYFAQKKGILPSGLQSTLDKATDTSTGRKKK